MILFGKIDISEVLLDITKQTFLSCLDQTWEYGLKVLVLKDLWFCMVDMDERWVFGEYCYWSIILGLIIYCFYVKKK